MPKSPAQPLRSMTGFGRGSAENNAAFADVELRSVNGKGIGVKLRVPSDRADLEAVLDARLRRRVERGNVQGTIRVKLQTPHAAAIDHKLLRRYLREWRAVGRELGLDERDPSLSELLALPGAIEPQAESDSVSRTVARAVTNAFDAAIDALIETRRREGERLSKELLRLAALLKKDLRKVRSRLPAAHEAAAARLRDRVQNALKDAGVQDTLDLTKELAALADRADVSEEVARLEIHLDRLSDMVSKGGPCGRELEFLIQECQREVTTLGNKSSDVQLSELVVSMKSGVLRMREQAANVE